MGLWRGVGGCLGSSAIMLLLLSSPVNGSQMFQEWKLTLFFKNHLTISRMQCLLEQLFC